VYRANRLDLSISPSTKRLEIMNHNFVSKDVIDVAAQLNITLRHPWPMGTCTHFSYLASLVCSITRTKLVFLSAPKPVTTRRQILQKCLREHIPLWKEGDTNTEVVEYISYIHSLGVSVHDIKTILLHALILLRKFRESEEAQYIPEQRITHAMWVKVALKAASNGRKNFNLGI
jgi:hypothetical protein